MRRLMILALIFIFVLTGCRMNSIKDSYTKQEITVIKDLPKDTFVIKIKNDFMLGVSDYSQGSLVVDPNAYVKEKIRRGDVIYFNNIKKNEGYDLNNKEILRVVGLGNEKIRMNKGKIYINDQQLQAFYGSDYNNDVETLKNKIKDPDLMDYEIENYKNLLHFVENENMKEFLIPQDTVFLIGDNRARAVDSLQFGPLPTQNIIGKVIGVLVN